MNKNASATTQPCSHLEVTVTVLWQDLVLSTRTLTDTERFAIGDGAQPCDLALPESWLEAGVIDLVRLDGGQVTVTVPQGATAQRVCVGPVSEPQGSGAHGYSLALEAGQSVHVQIGLVTFVISAAQDHARPRFVASKREAVRVGLFAVASAIAHAAVMIALAWAPPPDPDEVARDQLYLMQQYLQASAEREMEAIEAEPVAPDANSREGGQGTRLRGDVGTMGGLGPSDRNQRFGVPSSTNGANADISFNLALRDAAQTAMIGLANRAAGGDPYASAWERDDSLGTDAIGAGGSAWGPGLPGVGEGGGGGMRSRSRPR